MSYTEVTIRLAAGGDHHSPTKSDIDGNIAAIERAINKEPQRALDMVLLMDTVSILRAIQGKLS